ncbi:hypothetical protein [Thermomicrobium sp.]
MNMFELVAAFMTAAATTITAVLTALRYRHERALERRAFVQAKLVEYPEVSGLSRRGDPYRIELHNARQAKAENIRLLLDGEKVKARQAVGSMKITSLIPHALEPGQTAQLRLALDLGGPQPTKFTVAWDDPAGRHHSSSLDLSF